MSTKSPISSKTATSKKDSKEDLATLIYRESQLRKAETAAVAAKGRKKNPSSSTASTRRTSTRKRSAAAANRDDTSKNSPRSIVSSKNRKLESPSSKQDQPVKKVARIGTGTNALLMDVRIMSSKEECALSMEQR
jgi:hypothetical protein